MKLTLLTCTGDRPEAFALCEKWMDRQTAEYDQWIVVDDGKVPTKITLHQQYVRREPRSDDPEQTLVRNLAAGLPLVTGDLLFPIEDDDWYHFDYLRRMSQEFYCGEDHLQMVGEKQAVYYHVGVRAVRRHSNQEHASLCETVCRRESFGALEILLATQDPFLDLRLWKLPVPKRLVLPEPRLCVGIKGMPGRDGIGKGHLPIYGGYQPDPEGRQLRELVGDGDAEEYLKYAWEGSQT